MSFNNVRANLYNVITNDVTLQGLIGDRMYWIGKISESSTFPLLNYWFFDTQGNYSFGSTTNDVQLSAENVTCQIDIYNDTGDPVTLDSIYSQMKVVLNAIGWRNIARQSFFQSDINKVLTSTRWVLTNVSDF